MDTSHELTDPFEIPRPRISPELQARCEATADYVPLLFEWFRYAGILSATVSAITPASPGLRRVPPVHLAILRGLLLRCAKLMNAAMCLGSEAAFRETLAILVRCILESAVKVRWLCSTTAPDRYRRFMADGLKRELKFKATIKENIKSRGGLPLPIESRLLASIDRFLDMSGLTEDEVRETDQLCNFADMCATLDLPGPFYPVVQGMGSHAVHGTWGDLLENHLQYTPDGRFDLRLSSPAPFATQFSVVSRAVLQALAAYSAHVIVDDGPRVELNQVIFASLGQIADIERKSANMDGPVDGSE
jgi:hypothetical protein